MGTDTDYLRAGRGSRTKLNIAAWFTAIALTLSGSALVIAALVLTEHIPDEYGAALAAIHANVQAYMMSQWITLAFTILMPLGLIGIAGLAYQRRAWTAYIGACMAVVKALIVNVLFYFVMFSAMRS